MIELHKYLGALIVAGWFVLMLWGAIAYVTKREPNRWFWRILGALQGILILQIVIGLGLLIFGDENRPILHYLYGSVLPGVVLVVAHVLARGMDEENDRWKVFAIAAFFVFGLTLRALMTGCDNFSCFSSSG